MPIHISIGGAGGSELHKQKTPRIRTMPFSFADPFAASSLKMTSAEEMMAQMQAQMEAQMAQMQMSMQVITLINDLITQYIYRLGTDMHRYRHRYRFC